MDTSKVNRLEIIDHTPCAKCKGEGYIDEEGTKAYECPKCQGLGSSGRTVILNDQGLSSLVRTIELGLQDEGRTLKIFVSEV